MVGGLDIAALTAGDSTPGWEHRLRALRGRILVLSGDADAGRPLLRDALQALRVLGTDAPAEMEQLQRLLDGDADARTAERRVGEECVRTGRSRGEPISD